MISDSAPLLLELCVCGYNTHPADCGLFVRTLVVVLFQVLLVYVEVVVGVQLPELAVDNVEMFIGEELGQLVHILFLLQQRQILGEKKKKRKRLRLQKEVIIYD